ncbi:uncharacterized protein LOC127869373 isoform X2 [Dreissena polymorpha]|uniref:Mab-21-like HhH/H2TH-like domain-containing protein n=2 Tax=Dreissena polymorpha TaxID=45954 RepID=A0A9D4RQD2_DREPO|nr:uncharacterized protein LOC127869373 isoform X2 [Dreissena polymorpha]XP_052267847.1 uncharacterized protein LOC127869373 isoform X2 [Dreissena polymorpha]KAH3875278.1 hypothetical protein DPMN_038541 [Dreissena polymorpha]
MAEGDPWRDKAEHEGIPRNSGLYSRHSIVQCENASLEMCTLMNCLGYGRPIRQARRDAYREGDRLMNAIRPGIISMITTGSKAEGLTCFYESDCDTMFVVEGIMCLENGVDSDKLPRETTVFTLNTGVCYHGHSRLNLLKRRGDIIPSIICDALCEDANGRVLLCSALFVDVANDRTFGPNEIRHERAGPSMPSSSGPYHTDNVFSLRCHCPVILSRWAERTRHWPPPDIVRKVVTMGSFVTPVGLKGSEYHHLEWRICFNTGENELMSSLNNTQVYIYVLLKMVVKDVLKPVKKEITSYTVKNIVLWLAENNPQAQFNESSLFYWLREGLEKLRTAILKIELPYYMIPERNLMAACGLDEGQKCTWVNTITDMMNEVSNALLRLPRIRKAILSHPAPLLWYNKKRVEMELLQLKNLVRGRQCMDENLEVNMSDPMLQAIWSRIAELVIEVRKRMNREGSRLNDLIEIHDMMLI